jgi:hypothetical protein
MTENTSQVVLDGNAAAGLVRQHRSAILVDFPVWIAKRRNNSIAATAAKATIGDHAAPFAITC